MTIKRGHVIVDREQGRKYVITDIDWKKRNITAHEAKSRGMCDVPVEIAFEKIGGIVRSDIRRWLPESLIDFRKGEIVLGWDTSKFMVLKADPLTVAPVDGNHLPNMEQVKEVRPCEIMCRWRDV